MRIALLTYRGNMFCGGQGIYAAYLARELHALGHQVHVIAGPPLPELAPGIPLHTIPNENFFGRRLAQALPGDHEYQEVRLAAHGFDRPSLVFYCRREVHHCGDEAEAVGFLRTGLPAYLFVPEARWQALAGVAPKGARVLACYPDLYARGGGVVVVANEASAGGAVAARDFRPGGENGNMNE